MQTSLRIHFCFWDFGIRDFCVLIFHFQFKILRAGGLQEILIYTEFVFFVLGFLVGDVGEEGWNILL